MPAPTARAGNASTSSPPGGRAQIFFSARERAALARTEAVTLLAETHVPDAVYEEVRREFSDDELVNLTLLVASINAYNRVNAGLRTVPGFYQPGMFAAREAEPAIA